MGRYTPQRLTQLNEDYKKLAKTPWNVISGNNLYDAQFITYYTGVKTYHLPSVCDYTGASYNSIHPTYAIFRRRDHGFNKLFKDAFNKFCKSVSKIDDVQWFVRTEAPMARVTHNRSTAE